MNKYTVVLLRPDYIANSANGAGHGIDTYIVEVEAESINNALLVAQKEVFSSDKKEKLEPNSPDDYALCVMFEGHPRIVLFGWQPH